MPYFHATYRDRLPSIERHGLGGLDLGANSEDCERGVYLASDPRLSMAIMVGHLLNTGDESTNPSEVLRGWVFILIDDARIDPARLRPDPQVTRWAGSWLYEGVIDITGAVILTLDDVEAAERAGALPPKTDDAWLGFGRPPS